jgi:hypothetical protein
MDAKIIGERISTLRKSRNMTWGLIVIFAIFLVLFFGIWNVLWFWHVDSVYSPFFFFFKLKDFEVRERGWTLNEYRSLESDHVVGVIRPRYLRFDGEIVVSELPVSETRPFLAEFSINHVGLIIQVQQEYELLLGYGEVADGHPISSAVDKYGNPLGRDPNQPEAYYEAWLLMHEILNDDIKALIQYAKDFFGEEAFK